MPAVQKTSSRSQLCHQHLKIVASFESPTSKYVMNCYWRYLTALTARESHPNQKNLKIRSHRSVQVVAIQHDQMSHANSGIHRHHIRTHLIIMEENMDGRTINVGQLTRLFHGATRWIQVPDGIGAIALYQIRQNIIISSWVTRL